MPNSTLITSPTLAGSRVYALPCIVTDGVIIALNVWDSCEQPPMPSTDEGFASCSSAIQHADFPKADEKKLDDCVGRLAGADKPPVYKAEEDIEDTLEVLNVDSVPELQTGVFVGEGLITPIHPSLDASTRQLRRTGKLVLRKLKWEREKNALDAEGITGFSYVRAEHDGCEEAEVLAHTAGVNRDAEPATMPTRPDRPLERVMRPVCFSPAVSRAA